MIEEIDNIEQPFVMEEAPGAFVSIDGKEYSYFGGTGYYELHKHPDVIHAAIEATKKYGITSSSSRNSFGTTKLLLEIEKKAAAFFNTESALYLPSGFLIGLPVIQSFLNKDKFDIVFIDEISHYCNQYAVHIAGKQIITFTHLNSNDLENKIAEYSKNNLKPLIITDGIFPVYGKIAPLNKYLELAEKYNGIVWVDDAHSIGVLGENGRGTCEHFNICSDRVYFGGTLSKAFGGFGGIIPGSNEFINDMRKGQLANGSTPPPAAAAAASLMGIRLIKSNPELRIRLKENVKRLKTGLKNLRIEVEETTVPIAAWTMKNKSDMISIRKELMKKNILIQHLNYIGAEEDGALRIVVFSTHSAEQIDNLLSELKAIM